MILITTCILILAYMVMGKDVKPLLERVKNVDWRGKINALMDKLRPWALKAGRAATRPLLQFYYVMDDDNTSTLDRVLIYAAIIYTILPMDFIPSVIYKFLGILDDGLQYRPDVALAHRVGIDGLAVKLGENDPVAVKIRSLLTAPDAHVCEGIFAALPVFQQRLLPAVFFG